MEIGWGSVREKFRSRIYCIPGQVVEAVGGDTTTQLPKEAISHHDTHSSRTTGETGDGILTHLLTRWTVKELGGNSTKVGLDIEYQFANPLYAAMSSAVAGRVADVMIEAFEKRVKTELEHGFAETKASVPAAQKS